MQLLQQQSFEQVQVDIHLKRTLCKPESLAWTMANKSYCGDCFALITLQAGNFSFCISFAPSASKVDLAAVFDLQNIAICGGDGQ